MSENLINFTKNKRCAFYNDLSHMNPRYLVPSINDKIIVEDEIMFHKRNIFLLALQFDHILICTDNILGFTKYLQADIISKVVNSMWFTSLLERGVIVLCGWGANRNSDLMKNQIEYSNIHKPNLKNQNYINFLRGITESSNILVRESSDGEEEHISFFLPHLARLQDVLTNGEYNTLSDSVHSVFEKVKYIGTMEIFPKVEEVLLGNQAKELAFYRAYFQSWQEYSSCFYAPSITVDTAKSMLPGRASKIPLDGLIVDVISSLYSPDFFYRYLETRLGNSEVIKILGVDAQILIMLRNGDWKVFTEEYHRCIASASKMKWVSEISQTSLFLSDNLIIDKVIGETLNAMLENNYDPENFIAVIGGLISLVMSSGPLVPLARLLKKKLNEAVHIGKKAIYGSGFETENFMNKLLCALDGRHLILSIR